ncbi:hypothetical protein EMCRGX_G008761 [Ephydatia muelleri]
MTVRLRNGRCLETAFGCAKHVSMPGEERLSGHAANDENQMKHCSQATMIGDHLLHLVKVVIYFIMQRWSSTSSCKGGHLLHHAKGGHLLHHVKGGLLHQALMEWKVSQTRILIRCQHVCFWENNHTYTMVKNVWMAMLPRIYSTSKGCSKTVVPARLACHSSSHGACPKRII